jgi:hypothetical protein
MLGMLLVSDAILPLSLHNNMLNLIQKYLVKDEIILPFKPHLQWMDESKLGIFQHAWPRRPGN